VKTSEIDRVGQKLRVDAIAVTDEGGDSAQFASVVKQVVDGAPGVPVILVSKVPATIEAGIAHCADKRPLIYAATADNAEAMAKIAKEKKASLAVAATGSRRSKRFPTRSKAWAWTTWSSTPERARPRT